MRSEIAGKTARPLQPGEGRSGHFAGGGGRSAKLSALYCGPLGAVRADRIAFRRLAHPTPRRAQLLRTQAVGVLVASIAPMVILAVSWLHGPERGGAGGWRVQGMRCVCKAPPMGDASFKTHCSAEVSCREVGVPGRCVLIMGARFRTVKVPPAKLRQLSPPE